MLCVSVEAETINQLHSLCLTPITIKASTLIITPPMQYDYDKVQIYEKNLFNMNDITQVFVPKMLVLSNFIQYLRQLCTHFYILL